MKLALPNYFYFPSGASQLGNLSRVPSFVSSDLGSPIYYVRFWYSCATLAVVAVPKTSVDKNCLFAARKDNVGRGGQNFGVKSVAITAGREKLADNPFGRRIAALDRAHDRTAVH